MIEKNKSAESKGKEIRKHIPRKYSAEEKIRILIKGLRGKIPFKEFCQREGINDRQPLLQVE